MVDPATKSAIVEEYVDWLAAAMLRSEFDFDGVQLKAMRQDQARLWCETRQKVVQYLETENRNGTLDAAVETGTLVIDGIKIPALP